MTIEEAKNCVEIAAIFIAGFWTYLLFVRKRERYPRAQVTHRVSTYAITDTAFLLRVFVNIKNVGSVILKFRCGVIRIQKMKPWSQELLKCIPWGDPVHDGHTEIGWKILGTRSLKQGVTEIEPGEDDEYICDFVICEPLEVFAVYTHFENATKYRWWRDPRIVIGWNKTTDHRVVFDKPGE